MSAVCGESIAFYQKHLPRLFCSAFAVRTISLKRQGRDGNKIEARLCSTHKVIESNIKCACQRKLKIVVQIYVSASRNVKTEKNRRNRF